MELAKKQASRISITNSVVGGVGGPLNLTNGLQVGAMSGLAARRSMMKNNNNLPSLL